MYWFGQVGESCWWSFTSGEISPQEWNQYCAHVRESAQVPKRAYLTIAYRSGMPNASMRRQAAEEIAKNAEQLATWVGHAFVGDSALARGMLTAINWLSRKPFPDRAFATVSAASTWLARLGLEVPAHEIVTAIGSALPDDLASPVILGSPK